MNSELVVAMNELRERIMRTEHGKVQRGAALLDEIKPGWEPLIDCGQLDISEPKRCICGQAFRAEAATTGEVSGFSYVMNRYLRDGDASTFGFAGGATVKRVWVELIEARLASEIVRAREQDLATAGD